eukprot:8354936-Heterocapsa_arctica.AAC.1
MEASIGRGRPPCSGHRSRQADLLLFCNLLHAWLAARSFKAPTAPARQARLRVCGRTRQEAGVCPTRKMMKMCSVRALVCVRVVPCALVSSSGAWLSLRGACRRACVSACAGWL